MYLLAQIYNNFLKEYHKWIKKCHIYTARTPRIVDAYQLFGSNNEFSCTKNISVCENNCNFAPEMNKKCISAL